jgi:hypothetical protein
MIHLLNVVRWALVAFLFYVAALMKEEEEGRWENKLQEWLKRVYSRQDGSYAKITALAKAVANISEKFTERLFGKRLFSLRFLGVSTFYGLASANLTILLSPLISHLARNPMKFPPGAPRPDLFMSSVWFVLFVLLGSTPALLQFIEMKNWSRWVWYTWLTFFLRWVFPLAVLAKVVDLRWGHYSTIRLLLGILMLIGAIN